MKNTTEKPFAFIKKYLADILIIVGIMSILSPIIMESEKCQINYKNVWQIGTCSDDSPLIIFGIFIFIVGLDILVRKYLDNKNKNDSNRRN